MGDDLFSRPDSLLRRGGDDSLARGRLARDEEWDKVRVINAEALGCGRRNTDLGVRLLGVESLR